MARLVKRVDEWKANTIVDVGQGSIGRIFLWAQAATDQAQIIVAAVPGLSLSDERVQVLSSLARQKQKILCISGCADWASLNQAIKRELGRREADFLFMDGKRSVNELRSAFKEYRSLIRKNGLFGFDGLSPVVSLGPELDGAAIFWKETQRLYPQNAEYLMGCSGMSGGIAMVKL